MSRVDGNGHIVISNTFKASPCALTNPQDVKMVPFHIFEDLSCFLGSHMVGTFHVPIFMFWLKQTVSHTHGFRKRLSTWVIMESLSVLQAFQ